MNDDSEKLTAKDWRILLIGAVISAVLSSPSWLPVFGIDYEWFGNGIVVMLQLMLPLIMLVAGFIACWNSHRRKMAKDAKSIVDLETERDDLAARVEFYESEPERARAMFEGLTLNQISIAELARDSKRDFTTQKSGHKYHAAVARPDVFVVFDRGDGRATISLTEEWKGLIDRHDDVFGEVCRKQWSETK